MRRSRHTRWQGRVFEHKERGGKFQNYTTRLSVNLYEGEVKNLGERTKGERTSGKGSSCLGEKKKKGVFSKKNREGLINQRDYSYTDSKTQKQREKKRGKKPTPRREKRARQNRDYG